MSDQNFSSDDEAPDPGRDGPLRVFVVEDDAEVRERLCQVVSNDARTRLAGFADRGTSARRWLVDGRHRFDVMMVDLGLPDFSGLELISECRELRPEVAIMVLTMFSDERHVFAALERGATGYLLKSTESSALVGHLVELHRGQSPITPTVARLVLKRLASARWDGSVAETSGTDASPSASSRPAAPDDASSRLLSVREIDVLNQIAVGYTYAEIAERLHLSVHTVAAHVRRVYQKLEVHSRSAAVYEGHRRGLLSMGK